MSDIFKQCEACNGAGLVPSKLVLCDNRKAILYKKRFATQKEKG